MNVIQYESLMSNEEFFFVENSITQLYFPNLTVLITLLKD